ncbi:MAG: hypothetical protein E6K68_10005 [Nitrospirae bacterium]|nr:MAG: hypothetical protein E6K68_10005 [Nitrospirota bacterium]
MNERRGRVASAVLLLAVCLLGLCSHARAQGPLLDQILVTVQRDRVFAVTPVEGIMRVDLLAGEEVLNVSSVGLNALVRTSVRLLGFSSQVMRWSEVRTDLGEKVQDSRVTQSFLFVRTTRHLYGFQGLLGRWKTEDLGVREEIRDTLLAENVAVVVTDRRALAFSTITGGFFQQDLSTDDPVVSSAVNANVVILTTGTRRWIFRSTLAIWAELR